MNRVVPFVVAVALVVAAAAWMSPLGGDAQDTDAARIDALETQVASQWTALVALEGRVASLEGPAPTSIDADEANPAAGGILTIEGSGTTVTDPFAVEPANYKVTAEVKVTSQTSQFDVTLYHSNGDVADYPFGQRAFGSGPWSSAVVFNSDSGGQFYLEVLVTADEEWTITFEPL